MSLPDPTLVRDISPDLLRRYLISHGWKTRSSPDHKVSLFVQGGGQEDAVEIFIPASTSRATSSGVQNALVTLSQLLERPIEEVAREIRAVGFDIIRNRIPDQYVVDDAIELGLADEFVKGMRQLLTSSATTELNPTPAYPKATNQAADFAARCRFGHTFRGSFGFVVELPVGLNYEPEMLDEEGREPPLARRVSQRMARGLQALDRAAATDDISPITASFRTGLNANMCEDFADIMDETGVLALNIGIEYSPEWPVAPDTARQKEFVLRRSHIELLRSAAVSLRAPEFPTPDVLVVGMIKELETDTNPADLLQDSSRKIVINWHAQDGALIRVHVELSPEDYLLAVDAHKQGKAVAIIGSLRRGRKTYHLDNPSPLNVVPQIK